MSNFGTAGMDLNFIAELHGLDAFGRRAGVAIVQAPRVLPRIVRVPAAISGARHGKMPLTSIIEGVLVDHRDPAECLVRRGDVVAVGRKN